MYTGKRWTTVTGDGRSETVYTLKANYRRERGEHVEVYHWHALARIGTIGTHWHYWHHWHAYVGRLEVDLLVSQVGR